jgi:hypothetical protein
VVYHANITISLFPCIKNRAEEERTIKKQSDDENIRPTRRFLKGSLSFDERSGRLGKTAMQPCSDREETQLCITIKT